MRLLTLVASAILASPAAANPLPARDMPVIDPTASTQRNCPPISRYEAARRGGKLGAQRLGELGPADLYKAVYRRIGGCVVPVIAGYGFGMPARERR